MKIKNIALGLLALGGLASCQNSFDDPGLTIPVAKNQANITIAEFKDIFAAEEMQLCPLKDSLTNTPYIIKGRVISSDATGNIYQTLCIQDETSAMTFAVRTAGLYDYYHVGQEIVVDLTNLWVGKYNYLFQAGWLNEDNYGEPSMGRVDFKLFQTHVELNGNPIEGVKYVNPGAEYPANEMYCILEDIDRLPSSPGKDFYDLQGQLVEFRNVSFEGAGELTYAPYQESINRYIKQEGNSSKLTVRTSGYATFYNDTLPEGTGTIRGILSYYASDPGYATTDGSVNGWQLLIRSLDDVDFDQKGQKDDPYSIEEAIEAQDKGVSGWVKGVIVGSVKAGVNAVSSMDDIAFGAEAELDNNLVIAAEEPVTDWTQCMVVALPQGSALRQYGNLLDNPAVLGKEIIVEGELTSYLGLSGVVGSGEEDTFEIDGVELTPAPGPSLGKGDGTEANPYDITAIQMSDASRDGDIVWVEGYIAGYVPDMTWDGAIFSTEATAGSTNYTNGTNTILSSVAPGESTLATSIPVGLKNTGDVRTTLAVGKNPAIFGKKVKVKGELAKYFGQRGIKNVTEYKIMDSGEPTPTPTPTPTPGPTVGKGDGTEANPYNITAIQQSDASKDGDIVWVEGYIAGYVPDMTWDGAIFSTEATAGSTNYTNGTNTILSSVAPGESTLATSIPVGLKNTGDVRTTLAVGKNPAIFGKKVKVKGELAKYFGQRGIKNVTEYKIMD